MSVAAPPKVVVLPAPPLTPALLSPERRSSLTHRKAKSVSMSLPLDLEVPPQTAAQMLVPILAPGAAPTEATAPPAAPIVAATSPQRPPHPKREEYLRRLEQVLKHI